MTFAQTVVVVLLLSLFLSGVILAPAVIAASIFGAKPARATVVRMTAWGALAIVVAAYIVEKLA